MIWCSSRNSSQRPDALRQSTTRNSGAQWRSKRRLASSSSISASSLAVSRSSNQSAGGSDSGGTIRCRGSPWLAVIGSNWARSIAWRASRIANACCSSSGSSGPAIVWRISEKAGSIGVELLARVEGELGRGERKGQRFGSLSPVAIAEPASPAPPRPRHGRRGSAEGEGGGPPPAPPLPGVGEGGEGGEGPPPWERGQGG